MSKEDVYLKLKELGIKYEVINHIPIYTIEEANNLDIKNKEYIVKNLFLRDDKKRNYYLLVVKSSKKIDLNNLKNKINSRRLSFASEIDLEKYLKLKKGSVTPLGILNDVEKIVKVIIDEDILKEEIVGVHPNDNSATIFMKVKDLIKLIELNGNIIKYVKIGEQYEKNSFED